jgi:low affinity Fe/Cu permease
MTADTSAPERESVFLKIADYVSAAMGRPTNIIIWLIAVIAWTAVFAFGSSHVASGTWLPAWFTSQGFNFPLNLVTTVAELFIGFLVAAASNRSERNLEITLARLSRQDQQIVAVEGRLGDSLTQNTALTSQLKDLLAQNTALTKTVENLSREVHEVVCKNRLRWWSARSRRRVPGAGCRSASVPMVPTAPLQRAERPR